jgi:hypothetical protein
VVPLLKKTKEKVVKKDVEVKSKKKNKKKKSSLCHQDCIRKGDRWFK